MKKMISIIIIFLVLALSIFSRKIYAVSLNDINITTDKQIVNPNQTVKVNIEFGENLGSYTVDVAYDNNLFEFVSSEGGTANDNGTRVRVYFFDSTGGSSPRNNMSVTFKAKDGITTSNPTNFSITAGGLANADASISYDDITTPILKNIIVEPVYSDYAIELIYSGEIKKNEEKNMKIVVSSIMGKNYEHTWIIAKATTSTGGNAKLLATDNSTLEHDIIQNGWGSATGDSIGGKDVKKELNVRGLFSVEGNYSIILSLIDRDNSDDVIVSKTFNIEVKGDNEIVQEPEEDTNKGQTNNNGSTNNNNQELNKEQQNGNTETSSNQKPQNLPKTGNTIYIVVLSIVSILVIVYIFLRKKR